MKQRGGVQPPSKVRKIHTTSLQHRANAVTGLGSAEKGLVCDGAQSPPHACEVFTADKTHVA